MQRFIYCSISFTVTPSTAIPRPGDSNSVDKQTQGAAANFRPARCLPHFQNEMKSETLLSHPSPASLSVNVRGNSASGRKVIRNSRLPTLSRLDLCHNLRLKLSSSNVTT
ncbi:hypothetical protein TNIN_397951 [Trichonephila inaurata madagascariensis]|uniref:Uncharacterized protein n=1 Tax=Trichonephila inaurata madagascariensis TaxID=2747483 RepID=A0A8X7C5B0_9ARAC|nr:hypothetical protein TNIN_397951 [Trichonephila inaurata madagascariensis]